MEWFVVIEKRVLSHTEEEARGEEEAMGLRLSRTCEFGYRHIKCTGILESFLLQLCLPPFPPFFLSCIFRQYHLV